MRDVDILIQVFVEIEMILTRTHPVQPPAEPRRRHRRHISDNGSRRGFRRHGTLGPWLRPVESGEISREKVA
jgi:hypothetical protein